MRISENDQRTFCNKYGWMMAHHVDEDKTIEERLSGIDNESEYMLEGLKNMGVKEDSHFYQALKESYPRMKEDIKKFYK